MDKNDDEDEEVYMYLVDMHSDEWDGYQEIVHASNATEWERQQYEIVVGSKRKTGESSCPSGAPTMQKSQSMRHSNIITYCTLSLQVFNNKTKKILKIY